MIYFRAFLPATVVAAAAASALAPIPAPAQVGSLQSVGPASPPREQTAPPTVAPGQAPAGSVGGMGDINLYPKRAVLSDRERTVSIGLYNRASATGDYDIALSDLVMNPDGRLVEPAAADPAAAARHKSAGALLRWSPHRVTLPANEAQMVRIMARIPADLPPGEYRSHFSAVAVPPDTGELSIDQAAGATPNGIGVRILPRFGISIPVILRVGETTLNVGLQDFAVVRQPDGTSVFKLRITRTGTRSAFGDIAVTSPGAKKPLGEIRGVGVYTEIDSRPVQGAIDPKADPHLFAHGAKLTITYTDDDFAPGKILARQDVVVP